MVKISRALVVCMLSLAGLTSAYAGGLENVALGKRITPITNTISGDPEWVTDGVIDTGAWYSYQGTYNTNSFTIDLGAQYAIDSIDIHVSQVFGYQLHSSDNNSDWTLRNEADFGESSSGAFGPLAGGYSARYLKYWSYTNKSQYIGILEFQVYKVPDSIFKDGFDGLKEGSVCTENTQCVSGLLCCNPCGIPGCENKCTLPVENSCPLYP